MCLEFYDLRHEFAILYGNNFSNSFSKHSKKKKRKKTRSDKKVKDAARTPSTGQSSVSEKVKHTALYFV